MPLKVQARTHTKKRGGGGVIYNNQMRKITYTVYTLLQIIIYFKWRGGGGDGFIFGKERSRLKAVT